ncbi:hypothetical protein [Aliiglaciecola lipolytica]|uniref:PepSY domain-containing protein n=1 Tax=Aliiglaciecola lipolytica E3 TaxID=1127673 RepID=K6XQF7_9ALTE|nr:hypothetical protein [Aliiglaciecola lipolytica]GAC13911.1 hypothetical protein GLIP_1270 [Aliiglaciecola lipolytica E3]
MKYLSSTKILLSTTLLFSSLNWAGSSDKEMALAMDTINRSGITASQSIVMVQNKFSGVVYDYELDEKDDRLVHEIKLIDLDADVKRKITLSADDGSVIKEEWERLFSWFIEEDNVKAAKKLVANNYSMLQAIALIAINTDSLVLDVELEDKQGIVYFEIETYGPDGEKEMLVDSKSKTIIPVFKR